MPLCFPHSGGGSCEGRPAKGLMKMVPSTLTVQDECKTPERVRAKHYRSLHPPEACIAWSLLEQLLQKIEQGKSTFKVEANN